MSRAERTDIESLFQALDADLQLVALADLMETVAKHGDELPDEEKERLAAAHGRSVRTVQRWAEKLRAIEKAPPPVEDPDWTFLDRLERGLPFKIDQLFLDLYYLADGDMRFTVEEIEKRGYTMPSEATMSRRINHPSIHPLIKRGARRGLKNRSGNLLFVEGRTDIAVNEAWQLDEFSSHLPVRSPNAKSGVCIPSLLIAADWESGDPRAVYTVPKNSASSLDVLTLCAIGAEQINPATGQPWGVPHTIVVDNGSIFGAGVLEEALDYPGVGWKPTPAYTPMAKGLVENTGKTIRRWATRGVGGKHTRREHIDETDLNALRDEFLPSWDTWVRLLDEAVEKYRGRARPGRDVSRRDDFDARAVPGLQLPDEQLALMLPPVPRSNGMRDVHPKGVLVGDVKHWQGLGLSRLVGRRVQVRRLPGAVRAAVMYEGRFWCWAWKAGCMPEDERNRLTAERTAIQVEVLDHALAARKAGARHNAHLDAGGDRDLVGAATNEGLAVTIDVGEDPGVKAAGRKKKATRRRRGGSITPTTANRGRIPMDTAATGDEEDA